jgi:ATP-binding cassette subfamily B protein
MADLILVIADGRVAESGDHAALIAKGGLYAELYELQARAYR